jgi:hypothetical protein
MINGIQAPGIFLDYRDELLPTKEEINAYRKEIIKNSLRYNRIEISKDIDPVLRLMKKIGYEV